MRVCFILPLALLTGVLTAESLAAQTPPAAIPQSAPGRIAGSVLGPDGLPLQSAAITIRNAADSSLVTGALTLKDGKFRIEGLPFGKYTLRVSLIGYKPRTSQLIDLVPAKAAFDLGQIKLEVAAIQLAGVEAVGEKAPVVQEADRTVYNTKTMPQAAGNTADLLKAIPDLEVDNNNNVKLLGNQSVAIQLNGRPMPLKGEQLANFLQQLPANRLERVEVIHNPSAKNNPEEMGGILNIVLKDNADLGLSGSVNANTSTRNRQNLGGRINYQKGRLTLFTGVSGNIYDDTQTGYNFQQNLIALPRTSIEQNTTSDNSNKGMYGDLTAEFKVGKQATLSTNSYGFWSDGTNNSVLKYGILNESDAVRDRYDRDSDSENKYNSLDVGLGFRQIFTPQKHELNFDSRISRGSSGNVSRLTKEFLMAGGNPADLPIELTHNDIDSGNGNSMLSIDYFRPAGPARIDFGYRAWKREQDSDNLLRIFADEIATVPDLQTRSGFEYDEVFHSFYGLYGRTIKKFNVQVGLRAELTGTHFRSLVDDTEFERDYNTLYPNFNLGYTPKTGRSIRFSYSRSIGRPQPFMLNPVVPSTDPLNLSFGNPDLKPSYSYNYRLDMSYTGTRATFRVAPYYRKTTDMPERIRTVDAAGVSTSTWRNGSFMEQYGTNLGLSIRPTGPLNGSVNMSVYRQVNDGTNISAAYRRAAWLTSYGSFLGYKFGTSTTASLNGHYSPSQSTLQGKTTGFAYMGLGLRRQVWGTKGSLSLNVNDPFKLQKMNSDTRDATYIQTVRTSFSSRVASLGFTYNFGKPPQQNSRRIADEGGSGETIVVR